DRLTDVDQLAGGQRTAVAEGTGADRGLTGQDRAGLDLLDTRVDQRVDEHVTEVDVRRGDDLAVDDDVLGQHAGVDAGLDVVRLAQHAGGVLRGDPQLETTLG